MRFLWSRNTPYIQLFDFHHVLYISVMLLTLILLIRYQKNVELYSEKIRKSLLFLSIIQQVLLYSWYIFEMGFDISESLPLHISRISSLLGIYYLLTKNRRVLNVLFFFGLYAYGSFLYPSRVYPFYHTVGISFLINHIVTILLPLFAAIAYNWKPTFKSLLVAYVYFLLYFTFVYFFNPLVDGNYFYLKHRPFFSQWSDALYIPIVLVATFILFSTGFGIFKGIEKKLLKKADTL